jgi:hypothetical protein
MQHLLEGGIPPWSYWVEEVAVVEVASGGAVEGAEAASMMTALVVVEVRPDWSVGT